MACSFPYALGFPDFPGGLPYTYPYPVVLNTQFNPLSNDQVIDKIRAYLGYVYAEWGVGLSSPSTLPASGQNGVSWDPNGGGSVAFCGLSADPLAVYNRSGDVFSRIGNPTTLPAGDAYGVAFDASGGSLAVASTTSPYVTIYNRSGDVLNKLANPASLPTGAGHGVAWNPAGTSLAVAHLVSPYMTVYNRSGNTFTKIADPATLPTGDAVAVAWNPAGTSLAVAHATSPYVTVYNRSGDVLTKIANPSVLPAGTARAVAWSADGVYLAVAHDSSPYVTVYSRSGDVLTKMVDPVSLPASAGRSVSWSATGDFLAVGSVTGPDCLRVYKRVGAVLVSQGEWAPPPQGSDSVRGVAFGPATQYLAVAGEQSGNPLKIYKFLEPSVKVRALVLEYAAASYVVRYVSDEIVLPNTAPPNGPIYSDVGIIYYPPFQTIVDRYTLEPVATGQTLNVLAGSSWPIGSLVSVAHLAGDNTVDVLPVASGAKEVSLTPTYQIPVTGVFYLGLFIVSPGTSPALINYDSTPVGGTVPANNSIRYLPLYGATPPALDASYPLTNFTETSNRVLMLVQEECLVNVPAVPDSVQCSPDISVPSIVVVKAITTENLVIDPSVPDAVVGKLLSLPNDPIQVDPVVDDSSVLRVAPQAPEGIAESLATVEEPAIVVIKQLVPEVVEMGPDVASPTYNLVLQLNPSGIQATPYLESTFTGSLESLRLSNASSRVPDAGIDLDWKDSGVPKAFTWYSKTLYKFTLVFDMLDDQEYHWLDGFCSSSRYSEIDYNWPFDDKTYTCVLQGDLKVTQVRNDILLGRLWKVEMTMVGYESA